MNLEDFEEKLARQKVRPLPEEWRDAILESASSAARPDARAAEEPGVWWQNLLWPSPGAWASLAAVWGVIFILNLAVGETSTAKRQESQTPAASTDWAMVMEEQKLLRAELMGWSANATPSDKQTPQPRSDAGTKRFRA